MHYIVSAFAIAAIVSGCLPAQLDKYRNQDKQTHAEGGGLNPGGDEAAPPSTLAAKSRAASRVPPPAAASSYQSASQENGNPPPRATIYAVDRQTYRFALRDVDVWESALNVLLRNYNLTIVDRQGGILATEWDSFFLSGAVYRNKITLRLARAPQGGVDVTLHNSVERLRDASQAAGTVGAVWLPAQDPANETARVIQNMALVLGQPPPVLPPNTAVAKGAQAPTDTSTR